MAERWCQTFMNKLLQLICKQWLFQNLHVHEKKLDGIIQEQDEVVFEKVGRLMIIDPDDLLAKHYYLLEEDFHELGVSPSGVWKQWVCSMESEVKAADHVKLGKQ